MLVSDLPWDDDGAPGNLEGIFADEVPGKGEEFSPLRYALKYLALGWKVFPAHSYKEGGCTCGNPQCSSPGKHPRTAKGLHEATNDRTQIQRWWGQWPDANVGIVTGPKSGFWVLDVDMKGGGLDSFSDLKDTRNWRPDTCEAFTGGGGNHYLFRHVDGIRNRTGVLPGVDVRGDGGYIIVEPSNHQSGTDYVWEAESNPLDGVDIAVAPQWLVDLVLQETTESTPGEAPAQPGAAITEGGRNQALASFGGAMRRNGLTREAIEAALQTENVKRCDPPLSVKEVSTIAWSVSRYEPERDLAAISQVDLTGLLEKSVPAPPEDLEVFRGSDWAGVEIKERRWLVKDWMPIGQTTALYARGGTGKTLASQQLLTAAATGKDWFGMEINKGPAMGFFCEDDADELHRRQMSINNAYGAAWGDLGDLHIIPRVGHDNLLMSFDKRGTGQLTPAWKQLRDAVERIRPTVLVVDTAADTFGGNENIRPEVRQYVQRALTQIAAEFQCAVVLCAHPSVAGINSGEGTGGSTAWENSVRSRLYMDRDEVTQRINLTRKKSNYAAIGDAIELFWHEGSLKTYASFEETAVNADGSEYVPIEQIIERDFFRLLDHLSDKRKQKVSHTVNGRNFAPKAFVKIGCHLNPPVTWSVPQYTAAMERLIDQGRVQVNGDAKRGYELARGSES